MIVKLPKTWLSRSTINSSTSGKPTWALALILLLVVTGGSPGCSKEKKALAEIEQAYATKEYREAIALCKHAVRKKIESAEIHYYYGASLISLNLDYEGFRQMDKAAGLEPGIGPRISDFLYLEAVKSFKKNKRVQTARRMQKATEFDPVLDLGVYRFLVAESYFEVKDYAKAASLFDEAIKCYPDSSAAEAAYFKMAESYAEMGVPGRAQESLEQMLELYPRGEYRTRARWRLVNLLYEEGEKHFLLGNFEETVRLVNRLIVITSNPGLIQKGRFLLGETYEAMGAFDKAYEQYRGVIQGDRGASGRIVERAREKIRAFKEAGLY